MAVPVGPRPRSVSAQVSILRTRPGHRAHRPGSVLFGKPDPCQGVAAHVYDDTADLLQKRRLSRGPHDSLVALAEDVERAVDPGQLGGALLYPPFQFDVGFLQRLFRPLTPGDVEHDPLVVSDGAARITPDPGSIIKPEDFAGCRENPVLMHKLVTSFAAIPGNLCGYPFPILGVDDPGIGNAARCEIGRRIAELADVIGYEFDRPPLCRTPQKYNSRTAIDDRLQLLQYSLVPLFPPLALGYIHSHTAIR